MLTLHLLGHTHVTQGGVVVPVSRKAAALLAYLTLEGGSHHRDHLAGLLWDTPGALLNLRVELNRLRQQGVDVFPARQAMLSARLPTDLDAWLAGSADVHGDDLGAWLALLRGTPLSGLDDLGSSTLRAWLDHQRDHVSARIEQHAGQVLGRLTRHGHARAATALRARAQELGLELGPVTLSEPHPPGAPHRDNWPEQTAAVQQLLRRAHTEPQCVLMWGQRGGARAVVGAAAAAAGWHAVQLQFTPDQDQLQYAALRHLIPALPAAERADVEAAIVTGGREHNRLRLATVISRQPQPVVLALHDVYEAPEWLSRLLGMLMDLRVPLLLLASPTTSNPLDGASLAHLDWSRVHQLTLPPLSTDSVYARLRAAQPYGDSAPLRARATRIAQLSEGWAPYVDALLDAPDLSPRLPAELATRIRSQYGHVGPGVRRRLSVLAQLHDQFTPAQACELLGDDAADTVNAGLALGVLAHAALHDHVALPTLDATQDDADARLVFRSEVVRIALAGALDPAERQTVRRRLARLLLPHRPAMALYYAERVQDDDLITQARAAMGPSRAVTWQHAPVRAVLPVPAGPGGPERRETCTPNNYRLRATPAGGLEILRRGASAPPPTLSVALTHVEPGPWALTLRVDVFRASPRLKVCAPPYAVGVQVAGGPLHAYAPEATATATTLTAPPAHYAEGLPLGQDVQLTGRWDGPAGLLTLSFQAVDLACTVHALRWNGVNVLSTADARAGAGTGAAAR